MAPTGHGRENINERKISVLAIRYLGTIYEVLNGWLYHGMLPMERVRAQRSVV